MALDKVVDSAKLEADLTTVADAIRTKGGTAEQLAFPEGFATAVSAIDTALPTQEKTVSITENGDTTITPDVGKTLSKVVANVNVSGGGDFVCPVVMYSTCSYDDVVTSITSGVNVGISGSVTFSVIWFREEEPVVSPGWKYVSRGALNIDDGDRQEIVVYSKISSGDKETITVSYKSGIGRRMVVALLNMIGCEDRVKIYDVATSVAPPVTVKRPFQNPGFLVAHSQYSQDVAVSPEVYPRLSFPRGLIQLETLNPLDRTLDFSKNASAMYIELTPKKVVLPSGYNGVVSQTARDSETLHTIEEVL